MQHGLSCIGSIQDAAPEIIEHGVTGVLVDQGNICGLGEAIVGLLLNPSRREEVGNGGLRRVQTVFSFEQFKSRMATPREPLLKDKAERV